MLAIVDHGASNLTSLCHTLKFAGLPFKIIDKPSSIALYDRIIIPGVGNFANATKKMQSDGWFESIRQHAEILEKPVLGICLGMQLLATTSDESSHKNNSQLSFGMNLINGHVARLPEDKELNIRVPHIGWNSVNQTGGNIIFSGIPNNVDFYFVHSYFFKNENIEDSISLTHHGIKFSSAVGRNNIYGVQFHPEKSSKAGIKLLENFSRLT